MDETQVILKAKRRETGKKAVKAIRNAGQIPGIFYLKTGDSIPFSVEPLDIRDLVYTSKTKIINLQLEDEQDVRECILKQADFDPVSDKIIHLDFYGIVRGTKMHVEAPIILNGSAKGVREGGILQHSLRRVLIECLPKDLPSSIEIEISNLEIGHSIYIRDLNIPNVEFLVSDDTPIASVFMPRVTKEDAETAKEEAAIAAEGEEAGESGDTSGAEE